MRVAWVAALILFFRQPAMAADLPPFKVGISTQIVATTIDLMPLQGPTHLKYRPAESNYVGVILGYRWLAGTVSFAVPAQREIRDIEGVSRYRDYRFSLYFKKWGVEAAYNRYFSYLIDNSSDLSATTLAGQIFYKRPDLETLGYGVNAFYVFDSDSYSLPAALDQTDIQDASGGSWLGLLSARQSVLRDPGAIIPPEKQAEFGVDGLLRAATSNTLSVGGGYGQNWIFGSEYFVSLMGALTVGYHQIGYELFGELGHERTRSALDANVHVRFGLGFNIRRFFVSIMSYADLFSQNTESIRLNTTVVGATLSLAVRF